MTPVEIIALILVIAAAIKIIMVTINPKGWLSFAKSRVSKPGQMKVGALILAIIVFYFLIQELSIVQIFATMGFTVLLIIVGMASDVKPLIKKYGEQMKSGKLWKCILA